MLKGFHNIWIYLSGGILVLLSILETYLLFPLITIYAALLSFGTFLFVSIGLICIYLFERSSLKGNLHTNLILFRIGFWVCDIIACVFSFLLLLFLFYYSLDDNRASFIVHFCYFFHFIFFIFLLPKLFSTHYLVYFKRDYFLFLRPFALDNQISSLYPALKQSSLSILRIGIPETFLPSNRYDDTLYLPSKDWKTHLSYYISHSKYVFSVIDTTSGVMWEVFSHLNQSYKIIYYISDFPLLKRFLSSPLSESYNDTLFVQGLKFFLKEGIGDKIAFYFKGNVLYYGPPEVIVDLVIHHKYDSPFLNEYVIPSCMEVYNLSQRKQELYGSFQERISISVRVLRFTSNKVRSFSTLLYSIVIILFGFLLLCMPILNILSLLLNNEFLFGSSVIDLIFSFIISIIGLYFINDGIQNLKLRFIDYGN